MEHTNVSFNSNGTMSMSPSHPLKWVPEMSNGKEDDILVLPNIALLVSLGVSPQRECWFHYILHSSVINHQFGNFLSLFIIKIYFFFHYSISSFTHSFFIQQSSTQLVTAKRNNLIYMIQGCIILI